MKDASTITIAFAISVLGYAGSAFASEHMEEVSSKELPESLSNGIDSSDLTSRQPAPPKGANNEMNEKQPKTSSGKGRGGIDTEEFISGNVNPAQNTEQPTAAKTSSAKSKPARFLVWPIGLIALAGALYYGCSMFPSNPQEMYETHENLPRKELVDDLRILWSFERNFAHHHKRLSSSIEEMGAGYGMGADGYVLKRQIWEARWEAGETGIPCEYKIAISGSQEKKRTGAYRFRVIPIEDETGKDDPFSRVLTVFPAAPSTSDVCFVAICGPVDLRNDFSFSKAWAVYELYAEQSVVELLRKTSTTTTNRISARLSSNGDLAHFVRNCFAGLEWPEADDHGTMP